MHIQVVNTLGEIRARWKKLGFIKVRGVTDGILLYYIVDGAANNYATVLINRCRLVLVIIYSSGHRFGITISDNGVLVASKVGVHV